MPNSVDHEEAPRPGQVRVGIELEGVGTVKMDWTKPLPRMPTVAERQQFQATLKRSRLIRSSSFDEGRGVYLTPEEVSITRNQGQLGINHPAELVSSPHLLNVENLEFLRASVVKALSDQKSPMISRAHHFAQRTANIHMPQGNQSLALSALEGAAVSTTWGRRRPQIRGNLQTTVGVCAANLCRDEQDVRKRAVTYLTASPLKQGRVLGLLAAAVAGQETLANAGVTLGTNGDEKYRLRLILLMYLMNIYAPLLKGVGYEKDAFGCNIKGYSSFIGCGLAASNDALRTAVREKARAAAIDAGELHFQARADAIANSLRDAMATMLRLNAEFSAHVDAFLRDFRLESIGQPGLSSQVAYEKAPAIPCFLNKNKLYTLIEARQKDAQLNQTMGAFLRGETTANVLVSRIIAGIGT